MTSPSQSIKETLYIHLLRDIDPEWPGGKLIKSESPDFILKMGRKRTIGIELTDLTLPDTAHLDITSGISEMVRSHLSNNIFMQVFFESEEVKIDHYIMMNTAELVTRHIQTRKSKSMDIYIMENLPEGIAMIFLSTRPDMTATIAECKLTMDVRMISPKMLGETIKMKEEKLEMYNKRWNDELWLILTLNGLIMPSSYHLNEKIGQWNISSAFDRTLLFDLAGNRLFPVRDR